jgi:hypothetical protein
MSTQHGRLSRQAATRLQGGDLILRGFDDDANRSCTLGKWTAELWRFGQSGSKFLYRWLTV